MPANIAAMATPPRQTMRPNNGASIASSVKAVAVTPKNKSTSEAAANGTHHKKTVRSPTSVFQVPIPAALPPPPSSTVNATRIYWIRHGESLGQIAGSANRRTDARLKDCGLSERGMQQAQQIHIPNDTNGNIIVFCSPLLRALQTALLAFSNHHATKITVVPELREIGTASIPENQPRRISQVLRELQPPFIMPQVDMNRRLDWSHVPTDWPLHHDRTPSVLRRDKVRTLVADLVQQQPTGATIVLVCHYHVIRAAFRGKGVVADQVDGHLHPANAVPIASHWTPQGQLVLDMDDTE